MVQEVLSHFFADGPLADAAVEFGTVLALKKAKKGIPVAGEVPASEFSHHIEIRNDLNPPQRLAKVPLIQG